MCEHSVVSCYAMLLLSDWFDLHMQLMISPSLPILFSHPSPMKISLLIPLQLFFFTVLSPLSLFPTHLFLFLPPAILPLLPTCDFFYHACLFPSWSTSSHPPPSLPTFPSLSASLAGGSLQWVSIMEAGSGAAAAVGSAALGLLGATATSSHDILDR